LVEKHRTINPHLTLDGFQYALPTAFVVFPGSKSDGHQALLLLHVNMS
jgi:hypothetical protein